MSITGNIDTDRKILDYLHDKQVLEICNINKFFRYKVCSEIFFHNRIFKNHHDSLQYKDCIGTSSKNLLIIILYYIDKLNFAVNPDSILSVKNEHFVNVMEYGLKMKYESITDILTYCIRREDLEVFKHFRQKYITDFKQYLLITPRLLCNACMYEQMDFVKYLIENGADVNMLYEQTLDSALGIACDRGNFQIVEYLIEHVANVNSPLDEPLINACKRGHIRIVKYLTEHGADVNVVDDEGFITDYFTAQKNLQIAEYLIKNGNIHLHLEKVKTFQR